MLECEYKNCTGCGGCEFVCPKKAITMKENLEGFQYPVLNEELCVDCDLCNKVCPSINKRTLSEDKVCYAAQLINQDLLKLSASGGAFMGIAIYILKRGGFVFGVRDNGRTLSYVKIKRVDDLPTITKSKYYQCNINHSIYKEIVQCSEKHQVLVSGTPCMISALLNQKAINQKNIITFEILCQGVPSSKVIGRFYDEKEQQEKSKIIAHNFRSKERYVGRNYLNTYEFENGHIISYVGEEDDLSLSFQRQIFLRESCYVCQYANEHRVADFTGGDIWNYSFQNKDINLKNGCSVLLCNTDKAKKIIVECDELFIEAIDEQVALADNRPYHQSVSRPLARNYSYKLLNSKMSPKNITHLCCTKYYIKKILMGRKR